MRRKWWVWISVCAVACAETSDGEGPSDVRTASNDAGLPPSAEPHASVELSRAGVRIRWSWPVGVTTVAVSAPGLSFMTEDRNSTFVEHADTVPGLRQYEIRFDSQVLLRRIVFPSRDLVVSAPTVVGEAPYRSIVGDIDGDGWPESFGARNDNGVLMTVPDRDRGLAGLFARGACCRHAHLADLDLDGDLDFVSNEYDDLGVPGTEALLYWNDGTGRFIEEPSFRAMGITGYGETIVTFDYDNDGDLDIFLPYYSNNSPDEHNYLMRNDGGGSFTDVSATAGVEMRNIPWSLRVEGAQAADLNDDGWLDLYVGSRLFMNRGDGTFVDVFMQAGMRPLFDEGMRFFDWNNDGAVDIVLHNPDEGPFLFEQTGTAEVDGLSIPTYTERDVFEGNIRFSDSFGMSTGDLNNDGYEEIFPNSSMSDSRAVTYVHHVDGYVPVYPDSLTQAGVILHTPGFADFDRDGRLDFVRQVNIDEMWHFRNLTERPSSDSWFVIRLTGTNGEKNQAGRIARAYPAASRTDADRSTFTLTRIVDGGSGYLTQSDYDLFFTTPYPELHNVDIRFAEGLVRISVDPGARIEVRPDGTVRPL